MGPLDKDEGDIDEQRQGQEDDERAKNNRGEVLHALIVKAKAIDDQDLYTVKEGADQEQAQAHVIHPTRVPCSAVDDI